MTREEILKLEAGRELDALIFAKIFDKMAFRSDGNFVFSNKREYLDDGDAYYLGEYQEIIQLPFYSTDIAAAWEVVEKIREYIECIWPNDRGLWSLLSYERLEEGLTTVSAETAPLAICRAALLAVMESE
jgi:hypothetical protein